MISRQIPHKLDDEATSFLQTYEIASVAHTSRTTFGSLAMTRGTLKQVGFSGPQKGKRKPTKKYLVNSRRELTYKDFGSLAMTREEQEKQVGFFVRSSLQG